MNITFNPFNTHINQVRLSDSDLYALKEIFRKYFLANDKLWLFGSRADLTKRGGDLDLYIETHATSVADAMKMQLDFICTLEQSIGEQKIDVVMNMLNFPYPLPIHEIAKIQGVRII